MIQAGANKVISPYVAGGSRMARSLINPKADNLMRVFLGNDNYDMELKVEKIKPDNRYLGKTVNDMNCSEKNHIIVGIRNHEGQIMFAPKYATILEEGFEILLLDVGQEIVTDG